jgi:glycosyltransferase involved in cell wall biosynthesis
VLERWPAAGRITRDALTTVANWRGYGSVEHEGFFYGQKAHSWRQFFSLPARTTERFAPALAIHPEEDEDLAALRANGWHLIDPERVAQTPAGYRRFVRGSKAEFGIAKSGYVAARCGWFSDRSVCYLASGRPVIAQETGFGRFLPVGDGLFAFETIDEVLASIEALNGDYDRHARAARAVAEEHFDSDKVLGRLLGALGVT